MNRIIVLAALVAPLAQANVDIVGNIQSRCVITTDTAGVYGNPIPSKLSTTPADGGVEPIVRYDVALAEAYTARITTPSSFSTSPTLNDTVVWTGAVATSRLSDTNMADYDTNKVTYDNTAEFDLHTAGSTWFKIGSTATYGYAKPLPAGTYRAVVKAECIAN